VHVYFRNVNDAFRGLVELFRNEGRYLSRPWPGTGPVGAEYTVPIVKEASRNGPVLRIDQPVTVTYEKPWERVLFNSVRDANPFFHLYESLWMLAGRNDVATVAYYAKQMREYSEDGKTLNGAYGYRWRNQLVNVYEHGDPTWQPVDQLDVLVAHLKADPTSRRAVLQMWNVENDLLKIGQSKDVCCNLSVMFTLREVDERVHTGDGNVVNDDGPARYLDMTVTNRSNDLCWGMLGANYVHFTILQEYLAARLGVEVGRYHHFTNNLHVYETRPDWKPAELLADDLPEGLGRYEGNRADPLAVNFVGTGAAKLGTVPLVRDPASFEDELLRIVEHWSGKRDVHAALADGVGTRYTEPFLRDVADPMFAAFACHKAGHDHDAFTILGNAEGMADDWKIAAEAWLTRRVKRRADRVEGK
jgi:thymidylate synthase